MKTRKSLYQTLGILFIVLDIMLTCYLTFEFKRRFHHVNLVAALLPLQLLLIPGLLFIVGAYRVQKKIDQQNKNALENAFAD